MTAIRPGRLEKPAASQISPRVASLLQSAETFRRTTLPQDVSNAETQPHLKRVLGQRDLGAAVRCRRFQFECAAIDCGQRRVTIWLWIISLVLFFWRRELR